jgi:gamma-glutamyl-gamma-aminobutyrate hydrolase PuuD
MEKKKRKVFVIGTYIGYASSIYNREMVGKIEDADVVVLTGGADVDPSTYSKPAEPESYGYKARDIFEISEYHKVRNDQVVVGICRGAQLLTVLNGGILVQHVTGHCNGMHKMIDTCGKIYPISSLHHQMCYPFDIPKSDYEILFTSYPARSSVYKGDGVDPEMIEANGEPEIIIYHKDNQPIGLAVQGHPEMMDYDCRTVRMFNDLIDECLEMARKRKEDV